MRRPTVKGCLERRCFCQHGPLFANIADPTLLLLHSREEQAQSEMASLLLRRGAMSRGFHSSAPSRAKKTIVELAKEVPLKGKSVFVRADLNVPVKGGVVKDKTRIVLSAPTIRFLLDQGAKVRRQTVPPVIVS